VLELIALEARNLCIAAGHDPYELIPIPEYRYRMDQAWKKYVSKVDFEAIFARYEVK
jgi:hypothetical protein